MILVRGRERVKGKKNTARMWAHTKIDEANSEEEGTSRGKTSRGGGEAT